MDFIGEPPYFFLFAFPTNSALFWEKLIFIKAFMIPSSVAGSDPVLCNY